MTDNSEHLLRIFKELGPEDRYSLLAFAQFLHQRVNSAAIAQLSETTVVESRPTLAEPEPIPRPDEERVIAAIKRLSRTYPMFNKNDLMGDTSTLLTRHVLEGREANLVIDELEALFRERFEQLKDEFEQG